MQPAANLAPKRANRETAGAAILIVLFLLVSLVTLTRTPIVYVDEPQYADPAANLYFGRGFTSTLWRQPPDVFWTGNVPLFQWIQWLFYKVAGFGFFQARLVNLLLAAAGGGLIWSALKRSNFIRQPAHRLLALALVLSGSLSTATFRTIRPDATMFFCCALVFYASNLITPGAVRYLFAGAAAMLLPFAGIPMLPYVGVMLVLNVVIYRFTNLRLFIAIGAGMLAGIAGLALFYQHFSSVKTFLGTILPFTGIGAGNHGQYPTLGERLFGNGPGSETIWTAFFGLPFDPRIQFDYSEVLLLAAAVIVALTAWKRANSESRRLIVFALAIVLIVPPIMHLAGHFRYYYHWMVYIPLAIAIPRLLEVQSEAAAPSRSRYVVVAAIGVSLFLGIPARTLLPLANWNGRSTNPLERISPRIARAEDVVVANYRTYFALRPHVRLLYCYGLTARGDFGETPNLATNEITLLALFPDDLSRVTNRVGGSWKKVVLDGAPGAAELAKSRYNVDFYRRNSVQ